MNAHHLALFHAVARAGSMSGGAALANVSQPAVSRQIADLEAALGVQLFDRYARGCRLTGAGELLADYAGRLHALEAETEQAIAAYRRLQRGRISIGASRTIGAYLLPPLLAEFHRAQPEIELKLQINTTRVTRAGLHNGIFDVALTEGPLGIDEPGTGRLASEVLVEEEMMAVAAPGHELCARAPVTMADLARAPVILREPGSGTREVIERAFARRGLQLRPILEVVNPQAIMNLVAAGLGVAVTSRLVAARDLATGAIVQLAVRDFALRRPFYVQRVPGRTDSPALTAFLALLTARARSEPVPAPAEPPPGARPHARPGRRPRR